MSLFTAQAKATPGAVALVFEDRQLTYQQLDEQSNQLAHLLVKQGLQSQQLVGLCVERSLEMVVAMLAVLKAGGAYLPIDPAYPTGRIGYLLSDSAARLVVTTTSCRDKLDGLIDPARLLDLDALSEQLRQEPVHAPDVRVSAHQLAYVIYTSGSTGQPKGVLVEHKGVVNLVLSQSATFGLEAHERVLQFSSYCFDASVEQILLALTRGACLVLPGQDQQLDGAAFQLLLHQQAITHLDLTPSFLETLSPHDYPSLRRIVVGGEACRPALAARWSPLVAFYNVYGPTEATVTATLHQCRPGDQVSSLPIGRPIANVQVYVLDGRLGLCPLGVAGELCIGGAGLARGYLNQPALTQEKFVDNPFGPGKLYRSGDLGRWLPDGNLEYLGRKDEQVKIRGYRIELGEIEQVLQQSEWVKRAVVTATADHHGNKRLVGYVVPQAEFDKEALGRYLLSRLPEYMVPSLLVPIGQVPVTANGKVDKNALPRVDVSQVLARQYVAPTTPTQLALAGAWQQLLGVERVGIHDNFFELGGHSILMVQLLSHLRRLNFRMQLKDLFVHQTIAAQAEALPGPPATAAEDVPGGPAADPSPGPEAAGGHLLLLHAGPAGPPVFILPGARGVSDGYDELARAFGSTYRVYGLQMQGVLPGEEPLRSVGEIAARNIEWIKQVQPEGPYRFIGHSFGGHVAYEMTRQLEKRGEAVAFTVILDMATAPQELEHNVDTVMNGVCNFLERYKLIARPHPAWIAALREDIAGLPTEAMMPRIAQSVRKKLPGHQERLDLMLSILHLGFVNSAIRHCPAGRVNAPLLVAKAEETHWQDAGEDLGWGRHAAAVHVTTLPGNHLAVATDAEAVRRLVAYVGARVPWDVPSAPACLPA